EIVGNSRGILGWEAELIITKPVSGASTTIYYRSMDKYQEPFTFPANWKGALETQRYTCDVTETVVTARMGLYLATGIAQDSRVKVAQFGVRKV
ncbi:SGNH/GDSL hydrolase family protein, partial [Pseudomonas sp. P2647]|nr:SGNH/GDSL hydrolase family protein [Pseudomonas petrae]